MSIRGFLEFASASSVRRWAYDSDVPATDREIIVRVDDTVVASAVADIQRNELVAAGIGDGSHGFNVDLAPGQIPAETLVALEVHAISGASTITLSRAVEKSNRITDLVSDAKMPVADEARFPVFILGPARSGTSASRAVPHSKRYRSDMHGQPAL